MPEGWQLLSMVQMLQDTELFLCGLKFPGYFLNLVRAEDTAQQVALQP